MMSLSKEKQSEVTEALSLTSRYLDDLLNIDNKYMYFDGLISQIYPELQSIKSSSSETEALFFGFARIYWMGLFHAKSMVNAMILILRL